MKDYKILFETEKRKAKRLQQSNQKLRNEIYGLRVDVLLLVSRFERAMEDFTKHYGKR